MLYTAIKNAIAVVVLSVWALSALVGFIDEDRKTDPQIHVVFMSTMTLLMAADKFIGPRGNREKEVAREHANDDA